MKQFSLINQVSIHMEKNMSSGKSNQGREIVPPTNSSGVSNSSGNGYGGGSTNSPSGGPQPPTSIIVELTNINRETLTNVKKGNTVIFRTESSTVTVYTISGDYIGEVIEPHKHYIENTGISQGIVRVARLDPLECRIKIL